MKSLQRDEIEKQLIEDWKEILHVSEIGPHDHFFDLGGDSLAAMACISHMKSSFGVEVPFDAFFLDEASVSDFAQTIMRLQK